MLYTKYQSVWETCVSSHRPVTWELSDATPPAKHDLRRRRYWAQTWTLPSIFGRKLRGRLRWPNTWSLPDHHKDADLSKSLLVSAKTSPTSRLPFYQGYSTLKPTLRLNLNEQRLIPVKKEAKCNREERENPLLQQTWSEFICEGGIYILQTQSSSENKRIAL